jgi:hypothetical protein
MNDLAEILAKNSQGAMFRQGKVSGVAAGVADVVIGDATVKARYLMPAPATGATVLLVYVGNSPVVVGAFASKTATLSEQKDEGE